GILATNYVSRLERTHRLEHLRLLGMYCGKPAKRRRLHRQQRHDLKQVILNHVAQTTRALVKRTAAFDPEGFRQSNLHACHTVAIPDRFEERIGEPEVEDVHDGFFAEEVINAED